MKVKATYRPMTLAERAETSHELLSPTDTYYVIELDGIPTAIAYHKKAAMAIALLFAEAAEDV